MAENGSSYERQKLPQNFAEDSEEGIAESWESAGDGALERQLDQRTTELRKEQERMAALQLAESKEAEAAAEQDEQATPVLKILRRPESSGNLEQSSGAKSMQHTSSTNSMKTLEEREKDYMEARMRIFGDAGPPMSESASNESLNDGDTVLVERNPDSSPMNGRSSSSGSDSRKNSAARNEEGLTPNDLKDQSKAKSGESKGKNAQKNRKSSYTGRTSGPKVVLDLTVPLNRPRGPPPATVLPPQVAIRMPDMSRPPPPLMVRPPAMMSGPNMYQAHPPGAPRPPHHLRYPPGVPPVADPSLSPYGCPPNHVVSNRQFHPVSDNLPQSRPMQSGPIPPGLKILPTQGSHAVSFKSATPKAQVGTDGKKQANHSPRDTSTSAKSSGPIRILRNPESKNSDYGGNRDNGSTVNSVYSGGDH